MTMTSTTCGAAGTPVTRSATEAAGADSGAAAAPPPPDPRNGAPGRPTPLADPRTILLALAVVNGVILGRGSFAGVIAGAVFTAIVLLFGADRRGGRGSARRTDRGAARRSIWPAIRRTLIFASVFGAFAAMYLATPLFPQSAATAMLMAVGFWCARFAVALGMGAWAVRSIEPTELTASLRALRVPGFLTIPLAVVVRIIPVIAAEARAIGEAMTLRGLRPGLGSFLAHPVRSAEMLLIPLLSTVVRAGDELAASAMIRGLGGPARPTTVTDLAFRAVDAALIAGAAVVVVVALTIA